MSAKKGIWRYRGTTTQYLKSGTMAISSESTAVGSVSSVWFSIRDIDGVSRLEELKAITQDSLISLKVLPTEGNNGQEISQDTNLSWILRVSGEPYFAPRRPVPDIDPDPYFTENEHYVFPVGSVSSDAGDEWTPGIGAWYNPDSLFIMVQLNAPSQATSFNTVSMPDTVLTTWDPSSFESRSSRWDTREGDVRKVIYKMTQAKSNISFVYRESLRSMIASFNDVGYIDSEEKFNSIMCIHANAERAIAKLKQENNIILPIISIGQTVSDNDAARQKTESLLVNEKYWDAEKHRAFRVLSLAPRAVNVKYQVNIWTKYMSDMDQILEQIRLKFNPEMQVPTEFSTLAKAYLDSEDDVGQISVADKEDRVLKKTMNIVLRTYIPSPKFLYTSTGKIEEFKVENC